ncbi:MAG: hypothetical protein P8X65_15135 [Syntrophobacterales bacterium]|jgi:hypothetical protein
MWENPSSTKQTSSTLNWLLRLCLLLWVLQLAWLGWLLREELVEVPRRLWSHSTGEAVRQEDPFYRWLVQVDQVIPPHAAYLFLDRYEAGKEIEARYLLFPRPHHLLRPQASPNLLFYTLRQEHISYLLVRDPKLAVGPGLKAATAVNAAEPLPLAGPGLVFRVNPDRITGDFYD